MKKQRFSEEEEADGGDEWLLTYGDLMTQLVCFFVLLIAFSSMNANKFQEALISIQLALGGGAASGVLSELPAAIDSPTHSSKLSIEEDKFIELKGKIDEYISEQNLEKYVEANINNEGLQITLKQQEPEVFFDTAEAFIKKEAYPIISKIGLLIREITNDIRVEGHTDIRPINTLQFPSNWELSIMRATNVLKYLNANCRISADRLSAAGYGPYKPIASNNAESGMSKNRRVEIIILKGKLESKEGNIFGEKIVENQKINP